MDKIKSVAGGDSIINILFVDDDPNFLDASRILLMHLGYKVTPAHNSSEAIDILKKYHDVFNVVITDYDMPGMNGIELALEVNKFLADTPIILFTGRMDVTEETAIRGAGIAEVVRKPCRMKDLDTIIKKVIVENYKL